MIIKYVSSSNKKNDDTIKKIKNNKLKNKNQKKQINIHAKHTYVRHKIIKMNYIYIYKAFINKRNKNNKEERELAK